MGPEDIHAHLPGQVFGLARSCWKLLRFNLCMSIKSGSGRMPVGPQKLPAIPSQAENRPGPVSMYILRSLRYASHGSRRNGTQLVGPSSGPSRMHSRELPCRGWNPCSSSCQWAKSILASALVHLTRQRSPCRASLGHAWCAFENWSALPPMQSNKFLFFCRAGWVGPEIVDVVPLHSSTRLREGLGKAPIDLHRCSAL